MNVDNARSLASFCNLRRVASLIQSLSVNAPLRRVAFFAAASNSASTDALRSRFATRRTLSCYADATMVANAESQLEL